MSYRVKRYKFLRSYIYGPYLPHNFTLSSLLSLLPFSLSSPSSSLCRTTPCSVVYVGMAMPQLVFYQMTPERNLSFSSVSIPVVLFCAPTDFKVFNSLFTKSCFINLALQNYTYMQLCSSKVLVIWMM